MDANGYALYVTGAPCTGSCLTIWPPLGASSNPAATDGLTSSNIGLSGGQVTYRGQALYYFESDTSPGEITGNGVGGFNLATP
jgi:predicted lipoprotein with Yx(FWY)xxD motif